MNKEVFNKYCAEVMGYKQVDGAGNPSTNHFEFGMYVSNGGYGCWNYNPYSDLNQLAEVVERLLENNPDKGVMLYAHAAIKQTFRDFVWSTKSEQLEE